MVPALIYPFTGVFRGREEEGGLARGFVTRHDHRDTTRALSSVSLGLINQKEGSSSSLYLRRERALSPAVVFVRLELPSAPFEQPPPRRQRPLAHPTDGPRFFRGRAARSLWLPMPRMQKTSRKCPLIVPEWQSSAALPTTG